MFSVAEEEDFRCSRFSTPLLLVSKGHGLKAKRMAIAQNVLR